MKKGFPNTFLGFKIGWEDRGLVGEKHKDDGTVTVIKHEYCMHRARIGREGGGDAFMYCPVCMIKIEKEL